MFSSIWISHWGDHGSQGTLGVIEESAKAHPILRGVSAIFGTTDVYEAHPPKDAQILLRGQVLDGMTPSAKPSKNRKATSLGVEQPINDPMMPIFWIRKHTNESGSINTILTCTMGAATDFLDIGLRRLIVNSAYFVTGLGKKITKHSNVNFIGEYKPSNFGFDKEKRGAKPSSLRWPTQKGLESRPEHEFCYGF